MQHNAAAEEKNRSYEIHRERNEKEAGKAVEQTHLVYCL